MLNDAPCVEQIALHDPVSIFCFLHFFDINYLGNLAHLSKTDHKITQNERCFILEKLRCRFVLCD